MSALDDSDWKLFQSANMPNPVTAPTATAGGAISSTEIAWVQFLDSNGGELEELLRCTSFSVERKPGGTYYHATMTTTRHPPMTYQPKAPKHPVRPPGVKTDKDAVIELQQKRIAMLEAELAAKNTPTAPVEHSPLVREYLAELQPVGLAGEVGQWSAKRQDSRVLARRAWATDISMQLGSVLIWLLCFFVYYACLFRSLP